MRWGDAWFFVLFASGCLGCLLLGWILATTGTVFVSLGWILAHAVIAFVPSGLHLESLVSLWGQPEAPGARHFSSEEFEKVRQIKRLVDSMGAFWDTC